VNFIDLQEQYRRYKAEIDSEVGAVMESAQFIMGANVAALERELAAHAGAAHAIGCSSGTDAILLALMALDVKPGDEIIVPDFTFFATAEVPAFLNAVPVFVDVRDDTCNLDPRIVERSITPRTRGIIAVSLFGQCADYDELESIAGRRVIFLIEDGAQSFGASYRGRRSCALTDIATTSFFPAKPLGCYGDGGAVFTKSDEVAGKIRVLLNHGQSERYKHRCVGMNGRLDNLQAAILRVKLRHFDEELRMRQQVSEWYREALKGLVATPFVADGNTSVWAQYTVRSPSRQACLDALAKAGIPTAIHYPIPLHAQEAFAHLPARGGGFPVTERLCREVFSLPMHPFLGRSEVVRIASALKEART
jgi:UDP-2-acetamido-2-deoxy-ribo-hexuluronate aminotransferase